MIACRKIIARKSLFQLCKKNRNSTYPADWLKNAKKELKDAEVSSLEWKTPEGVTLKPLYVAEDIKGLENESPGSYPYTRGPYATMYAIKP